MTWGRDTAALGYKTITLNSITAAYDKVGQMRKEGLEAHFHHKGGVHIHWREKGNGEKIIARPLWKYACDICECPPHEHVTTIIDMGLGKRQRIKICRRCDGDGRYVQTHRYARRAPPPV